MGSGTNILSIPRQLNFWTTIDLKEFVYMYLWKNLYKLNAKYLPEFPRNAVFLIKAIL